MHSLLLVCNSLLPWCWCNLQVSVKATGPNSLSALKLRGLAGAAVRKLLADKGPGSDGSSSSSNSVTMALKLAPPFHNTSEEVQVRAAAAAAAAAADNDAAIPASANLRAAKTHSSDCLACIVARLLMLAHRGVAQRLLVLSHWLHCCPCQLGTCRAAAWLRNHNRAAALWFFPSLLLTVLLFAADHAHCCTVPNRLLCSATTTTMQHCTSRKHGSACWQNSN
jgi:hypothetical protein